jgi:hypothetical protein
MRKHLMWIPIALLVGLVVGAWGPRSDLRVAKAEVAELKKQLAGRRPSYSDGVTRMLRIPEAADIQTEEVTTTTTRQPDDEPEVPAEHADEPETATTDERPDPETREVPDVDEDPVTSDEPLDSEADSRMEKQIEQAVAAWRLRSEIVRDTFVANAELTDEEAAQFDTLMAAMNMRLGDGIATWAAELKEGETPLPESSIKAMHELSGVLVLTYAEMDRKMPEDWRDAGERFDLVDFIDPSVAEPLIEVEDVLSSGERR